VRAARAPAAAASANEAGKKAVDYAAIRAAIEAALEDDEDMRPTLVRLAWHLSGTYDKATKTGGSEGATMRFAPESEHGANAGLGGARDFLEPIKARFPACTYADLYTLAGVVAIEAMGGPQIGWRPGRRDFADGAQCTPDGRLPDGDKGTLGDTVRHVKAIFARMGFDTQETVALIGAHAMGRCHTSASGYDGPYTLAPTAFSNDCYARLLEERWTLRQWNGPDQFESEDKALMMLPADMALVWDAEMRGWVELYAQDYDAWASDFARAFQKLEELGVKQFDPPWWSLNKWGDEAWFRKSLLW
jgi:cytochrome c peroxidase